MGHHHHYFSTPPPNNNTHNDTRNYPHTVYVIIFFVIGFLFIYNYLKYKQAHYRPNQNVIYQDDEDNEFPDINNLFPEYLERERRIPQPIPLPPPPPAYDSETSHNLATIEPPSYDSIVNRDEPNSNLVHTESNQSLSV